MLSTTTEIPEFQSDQPRHNMQPFLLPSDSVCNLFTPFSETAWPIKFKFHVEHPYAGGTKVCINGPGHMTKMAARAVNSKNLYKSSPEPEGL